MRAFAAISVVLLATFVSASFNVPLTKVQFNASPLLADRSRPTLLEPRAAGLTTIAASNKFACYTTSVGIGNPATYYNLQVDTGSSNTWCGANGKPYHRTSTSSPTGQSLNVTYASGNLTGLEYFDQVTLAPTLVITNQSIGDALSFAGFPGIDGIIGFGPPDLTTGTLLPDNDTTIPTIMNNLVSQGLIKNQVLGVYFAPDSIDETVTVTNGVLTYGGTDPSLYQGEVTYVPVTSTYPASHSWGINVTSATYGNQMLIPEPTAGIVDTGTTQVLLADDFFEEYLNAISGATFNSSLGVIQIPPRSVPYMQSLSFEIGDDVLTLDVAAQLFPQNQNILFGGVPWERYGLVGQMGTPSGQGLDFILGMYFMERYYTVFDTDNGYVGFARTKNTFSTA